MNGKPLIIWHCGTSTQHKPIFRKAHKHTSPKDTCLTFLALVSGALKTPVPDPNKSEKNANPKERHRFGVGKGQKRGKKLL